MQLSNTTIKEITENLDMGMRCFFHRLSGEIVFFPSEDEMDLMDDEENLWQVEINKVEPDKENFIELDRMRSSDAFRIMEDFAEITPRPLKIRLLMALEKKKPFAHFKFEIDQQGEWRERWFAFKMDRYMAWVREELEFELDDEEEE